MRGAKLGGNRTGAVYRARDGQSASEVAYKIVTTAAVPNAAAVARAERELRQLIRVQSPNIVRIIESGKTPADELFVAMELWEGETLDALMSRGPVDLARAKAIVTQIGHGLLEAQKAGVVHRDLAPKNVFISASGEAKVFNFPIAIPVNDKLSGVAEYASPEQGQGRPVDQRSNTYSLACIFYHLVVGEPPFAGGDSAAVFGMHANNPVVPPSQRRPSAGLGPDVDAPVLKALDKNSSRRHLTLRLFLNEIEAIKVAAAPAKPEVGFAKTMLFAGGSQDVQAMVQKAIADKKAKDDAAAASAPAAAASAPAAVREQPVETAATMVPDSASSMMAAVAVKAIAPVSRLTPPPVTPAPNQTAAELDPVAAARKKAAAAPAASPAPATAGGGKGANAFRETLWFKKGDVEQMVAEAKAKAGAEADKVAIPDEDVRPIEDRYKDDGTLTVEDRKNFSLRSGGTAANMPAAKVAMGNKMSANEVIEELGGGKKTGVYIAVVAVVVVVVVAILLLMGGGKKEEHAPAAAAEPVAAPVAVAPAPAPSRLPEQIAAPVPEPAAAPAPAAAVARAPEKKASRSPSRKKDSKAPVKKSTAKRKK